MAGPRLHTIKLVRDSSDQPKLTWQYTRNRRLLGIETVVIPVVNIIYAARDVILRKVKLADSGLEEFRDLVSTAGVALVPALALRETAPEIRKECRQIFDLFLDEFCGLGDHPLATPPQDEDEVDSFSSCYDTKYLSQDPLVLMSYYYVSKMHQIWLDYSVLERVRMFELFLYELIAEVDVIPAMDVEIAAFCFCDENAKSGSQPGYTNAAKSKISTMRKNFLGEAKKVRTFKGRMEAISNSVRDLGYFYLARGSEDLIFGGLKQDPWVATFDGKLASVAEHFYTIRSVPGGILSASDRPFDLGTQKYWKQVDDIRRQMAYKRQLKYSQAKVVSDSWWTLLPKLIKENIRKIRTHYPAI